MLNVSWTISPIPYTICRTAPLNSLAHKHCLKNSGWSIRVLLNCRTINLLIYINKLYILCTMYIIRWYIKNSENENGNDSNLSAAKDETYFFSSTVLLRLFFSSNFIFVSNSLLEHFLCVRNSLCSVILRAFSTPRWRFSLFKFVLISAWCILLFREFISGMSCCSFGKSSEFLASKRARKKPLVWPSFGEARTHFDAKDRNPRCLNC